MNGDLAISVENCSACEQDHPAVLAVSLDEPRDLYGVLWTHYYTCPATGAMVYVQRVYRWRQLSPWLVAAFLIGIAVLAYLIARWRS